MGLRGPSLRGEVAADLLRCCCGLPLERLAALVEHEVSALPWELRVARRTRLRARGEILRGRQLRHTGRLTETRNVASW